jgi:hypothetical protein
MENLKITKGKWKVTTESDGQLHIASVDNSDVITTINCGSYDNGKTYEPDETEKANANLIVEAGNIANDTGLTPLQLLCQRNEMLAMLISLRGIKPRHPDHAESTFKSKEEYDKAYKKWAKINTLICKVKEA